MPVIRFPQAVAVRARAIPYTPEGVVRGVYTPNGLCTHNAKGRSTLAQARSIARSLGTFKAARYLRSRGWSLEAALHTLTSR